MSETTPTTVALDPNALEALVEATAAAVAGRIYQAAREGVPVSKAWLFQRPEQVRKFGPDKAPWYVGWYYPENVQHKKSCGPGTKGKRLAEKLRQKIEAEIITGTHGTDANKTWAEFRAEYETNVVPGFARSSRVVVKTTLDHFERIVKPGKLSAVKAATIDKYRATRRQERGKQPGSLASPATINKELAHLKAALRKAKKWGYLAECPAIDLERVPRRLPVILPPEHFAAIYRVCDRAAMPTGQPYPPADWWRALLTMCLMSGWRIGAILALRREDVDLERATVLTRAEDTKGKRDQLVPLHPVTVEHLRRIPGFTPEVFPWPHARKTLDLEFRRLQSLAGTPQFGFHALKKSFCTLNAPRIDPGSLQYLAQHASFETTRAYYINPESAIQEAVGKLYVPDVLREAR